MAIANDLSPRSADDDSRQVLRCQPPTAASMTDDGSGVLLKVDVAHGINDEVERCVSATTSGDGDRFV
jgi:hypothetical protein